MGDRRYDIPPKNRRALEQRLRNVIADTERPNDRYRDLIDLILVDRLMRDEDRAGVREVCVEIFRLRGKHAWPPRITVLPDWPEGYRTLAGQLGFAPADVHQAAIDVHAIIARIDTARAVS